MTVNVAVIGLGHNGLSFCEEYAKNPKSRLIAVCDIDRKSEIRGEKFHAAVYTDYSVLIYRSWMSYRFTRRFGPQRTVSFIFEERQACFRGKPMANRIEDVLEMVQEAEKHPNLVSQ